MKVNDIYRAALELMGYGYDSDVSADFPLPHKPLSVCNRVFTDLGLPTADSLEQPIEIEPETAEAACYGIAMFICIFSGDSARQPLYTGIYNSKRAKVLSRTEKIKDVMVYREG